MGYNTCIKFEAVPKNWYDSKADCIYQGGELLRIYDRRYLDWVDSIRDEVQLTVGGGLRDSLNNFWTYYNDLSSERFTNGELALWENPYNVTLTRNRDEAGNATTVSNVTLPTNDTEGDARTRRELLQGILDGEIDPRYPRFASTDEHGIAHGADESNLLKNATEFSYSNWGASQPDNNNDQDCVLVDREKTYDDFWCNSKLPYICQVIHEGQYTHVYHQEAPDLFDVKELKDNCNVDSCDYKIFRNGNDQPPTSWLNLNALKSLTSRPFYFKMAWDNGGYVTWGQYKHPLHTEDEQIFTEQVETYGPLHLAYQPPDGFSEFKPCDGIAFDGLTVSNRRGTFLDGSSSFENYYPVGVGETWHSGFRHAVTFPFLEQTLINKEAAEEKTCQRNETLRAEDKSIRNKAFADRNRQHRIPYSNTIRDKIKSGGWSQVFSRRYSSVENSVKVIDLWVSDKEFPWNSAYTCNDLFKRDEHSVSMAGYQCTLRIPPTTTTAAPTEATVREVPPPPNVGAQALAGSVGGGIAGSLAGSLIPYIPKVVAKAKAYVAPAINAVKRKLFGKVKMVPKGTMYKYNPPKPTKIKKTQFKDPNLLYEKHRREMLAQIKTSTKPDLFNQLRHLTTEELEAWQKKKEEERKERERLREAAAKMAAEVAKKAAAAIATKTGAAKSNAPSKTLDEEEDEIDDLFFDEDECDVMQLETININDLQNFLHLIQYIGDLDKSEDDLRMNLAHIGDDGELCDEADVLYSAFGDFFGPVHLDDATDNVGAAINAAKKALKVPKYNHGEEITEMTYKDVPIDTLTQEHGDKMEFVRYMSTGDQTHLGNHQALAVVTKKMTSAGLGFGESKRTEEYARIKDARESAQGFARMFQKIRIL